MVYRKYGDRDGEWRPLGRTPLAKVKVPKGAVEWKVALPGYTDVFDIGYPVFALRASYTLDRPQAFLREWCERQLVASRSRCSTRGSITYRQ